MKKMISFILLALALVGCNEVKTETAPQVTEMVQTVEVHDGLYKKLNFHRCKAELFNSMFEKTYKTYKLFKESDMKALEEVLNGIPESQDTLEILYACDKLIK